MTPPAGEAAAARRQWRIVIVVAAAALWLALRAARDGWRPAALVVVGLLLGATLYRFAFGFAYAYRRLIVAGDTRGLRAQLPMLALATLLFAPLLAAGEFLGQPLAGAVAPLGAQVAAGAFLFGIGMQLAGGCGSGTLYTAAGGSPRMLAVLAAFCAGSFWASLHMGWWQALPEAGEIALGETLGWDVAAVLQALTLAAAWLALRRWDSGRGGARIDPLLVGGLLLALLNFATLALAGHPWTITWAFALWGAKTAALAGWQPAGDAFWSAPFQSGALSASVFEDITSLMDFAILLGAATVAAASNRFAPQWRIPLRSLAAAVLGGLLMGYGARIAFGCNIGAFFSGVASTSLHGWLWFAAALAGSWLGVRLRPRFGLAN
ncbi:MAG: YeeE/YedE family protein [Rhodocyclales bacterium]|nr:YeeE/YedE family protein [Rhodocyclales bacterium]